MYVYVYIYTRMEIGGVASQNTSHFRGNCESPCQSDSQDCESLLGDLRITFRNKTLFM